MTIYAVDPAKKELYSKFLALDTVKEIRLPVLAITGESDGAAAGTRYIGENVPGAKFVSIAQASHISNVEQPAVFNQALRDFLSSPASGRA